MKKRSGELSFESILGIAFFALLTATLLAVLQFHFSRQPGNNRQSDIATAYNNVLHSFRNDSRYAVRADCAVDGVSLFAGNNSMIAVYRMVNDSLYRFDKDGREQLLIQHLEKSSFRLHPKLDNLLLITLMPTDRMQIPFFTSFALRGASNVVP